MSERRFPFAAVVGQDDAKLALQLVAIDPRIGGVLLRGEKGSAKTTLARGLADLLPGDAGFVDLPLGTTEDRLIGSLDLGRVLTEHDVGFTPGLLAAAHGGVLYVDEINLLADHLVDTLLDVAVSGTNRVERDGVSHVHDARFVLVGSMNPEEGELRPQLLDRFGLSVTIASSDDPGARAEAVRRRLSFDSGEHAAAGTEAMAETERLAAAIAGATPADVPDELVETASRLALAVGAEGLRADIVLCRASAAHAALHGRPVADESDLRRVAPLVLAHRSRRNPFDPPVLPPDDLDDAIDDAIPPRDDQSTRDDGGDEESLGSNEPDSGEPQLMAVGDDRRPSTRDIRPRSTGSSTSGRRAVAEGSQGRFVRDEPFETGSPRPIAVAGTVRRLAERRAADPEATLDADDVRLAVKERPSGSLLILVVDTSGSMGAADRAALGTGTALGLLSDAYEQRDQVALITFRGDDAEVVLTPTGSIEVARNRLSDLPTGGTTPLAAGLRAARKLARERRDVARVPLVAVITDGRATGASDAFDDALDAARELRRDGVAGLVLDCEAQVPRLGRAAALADVLEVPCIAAADIDPMRAAASIRRTRKDRHAG
ncbi:MAG: VWA domain-containing protein [Actinomycetota bacterium]